MLHIKLQLKEFEMFRINYFLLILFLLISLSVSAIAYNVEIIDKNFNSQHI